MFKGLMRRTARAKGSSEGFVRPNNTYIQMNKTGYDVSGINRASQKRANPERIPFVVSRSQSRGPSGKVVDARHLKSLQKNSHPNLKRIYS